MALINKGATLSISTTPVTGTLNLAGFDLLSFTPIGKVIMRPSFASTANIISQDTIDTEITEKQKGIESGEDTEIRCSYVDGDAGQAALDTAAAGILTWGLKYELNDSGGTNGTTFYGLFIIGGSGSPGGGNEDFIDRLWQAALTLQRPIIKAAA